MKPLSNRMSWAQRRLAEKKGSGPIEKLHPKKGEKGGACNRTACQMPASECRDGVRWFNHSTQKYYCWRCAWDLNEDPFNKRDAHQIWGHNLCTLES